MSFEIQIPRLFRRYWSHFEAVKAGWASGHVGAQARALPLSVPCLCTSEYTFVVLAPATHSRYGLQHCNLGFSGPGICKGYKVYSDEAEYNRQKDKFFALMLGCPLFRPKGSAVLDYGFDTPIEPTALRKLETVSIVPLSLSNVSDRLGCGLRAYSILTPSVWPIEAKML